MKTIEGAGAAYILAGPRDGELIYSGSCGDDAAVGERCYRTERGRWADHLSENIGDDAMLKASTAAGFDEPKEHRVEDDAKICIIPLTTH